jgi:hypothetical protein
VRNFRPFAEVVADGATLAVGATLATVDAVDVGGRTVGFTFGWVSGCAVDVAEGSGNAVVSVGRGGVVSVGTGDTGGCDSDAGGGGELDASVGAGGVGLCFVVATTPRIAAKPITPIPTAMTTPIRFGFDGVCWVGSVFGATSEGAGADDICGRPVPLRAASSAYARFAISGASSAHAVGVFPLTLIARSDPSPST